MRTLGRQLPVAALLATLAGLIVVQPALSLTHAHEHLKQHAHEHPEQGRDAAPPEEAPGEEGEGGEHCELCLSLSLSRSASVSHFILAYAPALVVGQIEAVFPLQGPSESPRTPGSPRAPPVG